MFKVNSKEIEKGWQANIHCKAYGSKPLDYNLESTTKEGLIKITGHHTFEFLKLCFYDFWFILNMYQKIWITERQAEILSNFWKYEDLRVKLRPEFNIPNNYAKLVLDNLTLIQFFTNIPTESKDDLWQLSKDMDTCANIIVNIYSKESSFLPERFNL